MWIEGTILSSMGWEQGKRFVAAFNPGEVTYTAVGEGSKGRTRKVAGKPGVPIIDTNTDKLAAALGPVGTVVHVTVRPHSVTVEPYDETKHGKAQAHTEQKRTV